MRYRKKCLEPLSLTPIIVFILTSPFSTLSNMIKRKRVVGFIQAIPEN